MSTSYTSPAAGSDWVDVPFGTPAPPGAVPLNAVNVREMDQGISLAHDRIDAVLSTIAGLSPGSGNTIGSVVTS